VFFLWIFNVKVEMERKCSNNLPNFDLSGALRLGVRKVAIFAAKTRPCMDVV